MKSTMSLGIIDRRNGHVVTSVPVSDRVNPHILPPSETYVWHYVKFEYFLQLLQKRAIYFSRLDQQSDAADGMYTPENDGRFTPETAALFEKAGNLQGLEWDKLQWTNETLRQKSYVHCWSARKRDDAWMWNEFLKGNSRSVAIRSTVGRLQRLMPGSVHVVRIVYYAPGWPRPDWSYTAPFTAKGEKFRDEREIRLMMTSPLGPRDPDKHKLIPVDLNSLITKVVVHPASPPDFRKEVSDILKQHRLSRAHACRSELRVSDLSARAGKSSAVC